MFPSERPIERPVPASVAAIKAPTSISKAVIDFLDDVSYKIMREESDLEQIIRMRHDAYVNAGHFGGTDTGLFEDAYDRNPNFFNIGVHVEGNLVSCVRLNVLETGVCTASPTVSTHEDAILSQLSRGWRFTDSNRLCVEHGIEGKYKMLPFATIRLGGLHAAHHKTDYVLTSVKANHLPFYKRILGAWSVEDGGHVATGLEATVHLVAADIAEIRRMCYADRQFFFSTAAERNALFSAPHGQFVLPSVRDVIERGVEPDFWF